MTSTRGQFSRPVPRRRSIETRQRLLNAAIELIADVGWSRVTTRALADTAGLPHGTVSYHFISKHELLTEAAADVVERMFPIGKLEAVETMTDLLPLVHSTIDSEWTDPVSIKVLFEAMSEAGHDQLLRNRIALLLREYRRILGALIRADQQRNAIVSTPAPALATLLAAVGDGLLLHSLLDPELDIAAAAEALLSLVRNDAAEQKPER